MSEEAFQSFTNFLECVPEWIADLEHILKSVEEKQNEAIATHQPASGSIPSHQDLPFPKKRALKPSSLTSKRSNDDISLRIIERPTPSAVVTEQRPQLPHLTESDALRLAQRKRKTLSNASGRSGPPDFKARSRLVVYYDGAAQKRLENMVRNIGTSMHRIRKGKMTTRIDFLSRSDSSSSSEDSGDFDDDKPAYDATISFRRTQAPSTSPSLFGRVEDTAIFDLINQCLEVSQSLCEKAAHQLLRDGNCQEELHTARQNLTEAARLIEKDLPRFKARAEKAARKRQKEEEEEVLGQKLVLQHGIQQLPPTCSQDALIPAASPISVDGDPLEVDPDINDDDDDDDDDDEKDDSEDELHMNLAQLSTTKFRQLRRPVARFTAPVQA